MSFEKRVRDKLFSFAVDRGFLIKGESDDENAFSNSLFERIVNKTINLENVPLYDIANNNDTPEYKPTGKSLKALIPDEDRLITQYSLEWKTGASWKAPVINKDQYTGKEYNDFDNLTPDFAYIEDNRITLIENKIGAKETYGINKIEFDSQSAQIARYIDWMIHAEYNRKRKIRNTVLLSTKEFFYKYWYITELYRTMEFDNRKKKVKGYLLIWEDILSSLVCD